MRKLFAVLAALVVTSPMMLLDQAHATGCGAGCGFSFTTSFVKLTPTTGLFRWTCNALYGPGFPENSTTIPPVIVDMTLCKANGATGEVIPAVGINQAHALGSSLVTPGDPVTVCAVATFDNSYVASGGVHGTGSSCTTYATNFNYNVKWPCPCIGPI